jgi:GNAT superfamily N-acetyltransferase
VRCLRDDELANFEALLLDFDETSRRRRFGAPLSDEAVRAYAAQAGETALWINGAFIDGALRGVSEVFPTRATGVLEIAFAVDQAWRNKGIASQLLRSAIRMASLYGADRLQMIFSRENWPMRKIAFKFDASLDIWDMDEMSAKVTAPKANHTRRKIAPRTPASRLGGHSQPIAAIA